MGEFNDEQSRNIISKTLSLLPHAMNSPACTLKLRIWSLQQKNEVWVLDQISQGLVCRMCKLKCQAHTPASKTYTYPNVSRVCCTGVAWGSDPYLTYSKGLLCKTGSPVEFLSGRGIKTLPDL